MAKAHVEGSDVDLVKAKPLLSIVDNWRQFCTRLLNLSQFTLCNSCIIGIGVIFYNLLQNEFRT